MQEATVKVTAYLLHWKGQLEPCLLELETVFFFLVITYSVWAQVHRGCSKEPKT